MRHLPTLLIATILIIITTAVVAKADPVACDDEMVGTYVATNPNEDHFSHWSVEIYKRKQKDALYGYQFFAQVNIACGSKVSPALYELNCEGFYESQPTMVLVSRGSSQCTISENAQLSVDTYTGELEVMSHVIVPVTPPGMSQNVTGLVYRLNRMTPQQ